MADTPTIYHNPRCSKSRATLALLTENGHDPHVVEYLTDPPDADTLRAILAALGKGPRDILRAKEAKEHGLDDPTIDDAALIRRMVETPAVIERPIVTLGSKAAVGRPPEAVLALFD